MTTAPNRSGPSTRHSLRPPHAGKPSPPSDGSPEAHVSPIRSWVRRGTRLFGLAFAGAGLLACLVWTAPRSQAGQFVLRIEGITDGSGDVQTGGFNTGNYVEIRDFNLGVSHPTNAPAKSGTTDLTVGFGNIGPISMSKSLDRSSTRFLKKVLSGTAAGTGYLFLWESALDSHGVPVNYVRLACRLEEVFVLGWSLSGDSDALPTEEVVLLYSRIAIQYAHFDPAKGITLVPAAGWDMSELKPWETGDLLTGAGLPTLK